MVYPTFLFYDGCQVQSADMRLATTGNVNSELKDYHCNEKCTRLVYASLVADERNKGNHSSSTSPLVEKTLIKMDTLCTLRVNTQPIIAIKWPGFVRGLGFLAVENFHLI